MKCLPARLSPAGNFEICKYQVTSKQGHPGASIFKLESSSAEIAYSVRQKAKVSRRLGVIQDKSSKWLETQLGDGMSVQLGS